MSKDITKATISRRTVLKGITAAAGVAVAPTFIKNLRAADNIKVGIISPLTGAWTVYGKAHISGFELAADEINAAGGVLGRQLELVVGDSKTEPRIVVEQANRLIRQEKVDWHGEKIDLLVYVSQNKNNFVIKPNDEYGGKGVVIGGEASQHEWENVLEAALSDKYVVQEKVELSKETFPYYDEGLKFEDLVVDLDPYLFGVNTAGCMTRLSQTSLANVTSGGGANATFIIQKKHQ